MHILNRKRGNNYSLNLIFLSYFTLILLIPSPPSLRPTSSPYFLLASSFIIRYLLPPINLPVPGLLHFLRYSLLHALLFYRLQTPSPRTPSFFFLPPSSFFCPLSLVLIFFIHLPPSTFLHTPSFVLLPSSTFLFPLSSFFLFLTFFLLPSSYFFHPLSSLLLSTSSFLL